MSDNKNPLSIDYDDNNETYESFSSYLENDTKRKAKKTAEEIQELGHKYLKEIEQKKKEQNLKKKKLIPYILKHSKEKYIQEELLQYSFNDIVEIYKEYKVQNRPAIVKFFHFLFNLE